MLGCLLGGGLGDALGFPVEFVTSRAEIERMFGDKAPDRLAFAGAAPALVSDDTQLTLFVAEGIIRAAQRWATRGIGHQASIGMGALVRWYRTQFADPVDDGWLGKERRLHAPRAPGTTIMGALGAYVRKGRRGGEPARNDSKGCGTVMRAAPFGFLGSREDAFDSALENAQLTHGHPTGALAAGYLAALVWDVARGAAMESALAGADAILAQHTDHEETAEAVRRAREAAARRPLELETLGGGWIAEEALAYGVACGLAFEPGEPRAVEQMLWRAACHGGDSDSTASITGNLLGAMVGAGGLPGGWLEELELRDVIERVARDLHAAVCERTLLDFDDYPPT